MNFENQIDMQVREVNNLRTRKGKPDKPAPEIRVISVQYQQALNLVTVRGSSIGDYSSFKYESLIDNIKNHFRRSNSLHLYFNYDFLDNSALAYLATVIATLNEYHDKGKTIRLFWSCLSVADNMGDEGAKLRALCKFGFHG